MLYTFCSDFYMGVGGSTRYSFKLIFFYMHVIIGGEYFLSEDPVYVVLKRVCCFSIYHLISNFTNL